jgi:hypothetical protein
MTVAQDSFFVLDTIVLILQIPVDCQSTATKFHDGYVLKLALWPNTILLMIADNGGSLWGRPVSLDMFSSEVPVQFTKACLTSSRKPHPWHGVSHAAKKRAAMAKA